MNLVRRHQRAAAWLALAAIAALALLPALSHALERASLGVEVCTPQGMRWQALDEGGQAPASPGMEHCPLCSLGHGAIALQPALLALPQAAAPVMPARAPHAGRTLPAWASAQPRAPPVRA